MTYSISVSLTLPSLSNDRRQHLLEKQPLLSLYEVFTTIADPRSRHGLRYELAYLLTCLVAGLLCNCDSTLAVAEWCRDQRLLLLRLFGPRDFLCPSDSLYRKLLPRLDVNKSNGPWQIGFVVRSLLRLMIPSLWMAKPFVEPKRRASGPSSALFSHSSQSGNASASRGLREDQ